MTITNPFEVIAAFVDGERVDPAVLKAALAQPDGRDYLVDMVALREVIAHDGPQPATAGASQPARRWLAAAAAAIVLSLAGGYTWGHRSVSPRDAAAGIGATPPRAGDSAPAPAPTRVIEVAPGSSYVTKGGQ